MYDFIEMRINSKYFCIYIFLIYLYTKLAENTTLDALLSIESWLVNKMYNYDFMNISIKNETENCGSWETARVSKVMFITTAIPSRTFCL